VGKAAQAVGAREELPAALARYQWNEMDVKVTAQDSARVWREVVAQAKAKPAIAQPLPENLGQALNLVLASFSVGDKYLKQAVKGLKPEELEILLGEAPDFYKDEDDTTEKSLSGALHREFGLAYDTSREVKSETILGYVRKLDRKALALSGLGVVMAATEARRLLESRPIVFLQEGMRDRVEGVEGRVWLAETTEFGLVIVGGEGDNIYRRDACLIIELGGDDQYRNRAGGAVGFLSRGFSVCIDMAGNDRYESAKLFSQGAGLFGCGVLIDLAGDDDYRAGHYAQGAGIFGTGLLWDREGRDRFEAGFCVQGAADYGVGTLVDLKGNDSYRSFCYCQGFAGIWAYGLLWDGAGNDLYYAGGKYLHEPLLPREYRSFAQGFAIGSRPDASGGIGFLGDRAGNDFYNAEVFCQGTSYWYALGMLWDGEGFDHYTAAQYTQGAGIHLSIGALVDEEGNDSYFSRLGPSQGEGHDLSVGVLVDRKGDDGYFASGGQGIGLTNSVGLFADCDGNDWYMCSDSFLSHGSSNAARGFGGMGFFIDLAGKDRYPQASGVADKWFWTKGTYGSGMDFDRPATVIDWEPDVDTTDIAEDSIVAPVESLFKTASLWEVGNVVKKVRRARKQLLARGREGVEYALTKKIDTKDGLELRNMEFLVQAMPDTAKPLLFAGLRDERYLARNNSAYLVGKMGRAAMDCVDSLLLALKEKRITPRRAANSLGDIGDSLVVPKILYLLRDTFEVSRIVTAEACGKLKNPEAVAELIRTLADKLFTVRSAAEMALVAIGLPSLEPILERLTAMKPPQLGHAVRAAGGLAAKLDSADTAGLRQKTRAALYPLLEHRDAFVRLVAVDALGRLMAPEVKERLREKRATEADPFVLTAYRAALARAQEN
ncbi:MAG: HEAT repeat domain-containing protein, partial [candidate division WOR-3 bacterium]